MTDIKIAFEFGKKKFSKIIGEFLIDRADTKELKDSIQTIVNVCIDRVPYFH